MIIPPVIDYKMAAAPRKSELYAGWRFIHHTGHPGIYRGVIMSSEEKSPMTGAITEPAAPAPVEKAARMVAIWAGSVLALFAVSSLFRLLMTAAGMKVR